MLDHNVAISSFNMKCFFFCEGVCFRALYTHSVYILWQRKASRLVLLHSGGTAHACELLTAHFFWFACCARLDSITQYIVCRIHSTSEEQSERGRETERERVTSRSSEKRDLDCVRCPSLRNFADGNVQSQSQSRKNVRSDDRQTHRRGLILCFPDRTVTVIGSVGAACARVAEPERALRILLRT